MTFRNKINVADRCIVKMGIKNISATPRERDRGNQGIEELNSEPETDVEIILLFLANWVPERTVGGEGRFAENSSGTGIKSPKSRVLEPWPKGTARRPLKQIAFVILSMRWNSWEIHKSDISMNFNSLLKMLPQGVCRHKSNLTFKITFKQYKYLPKKMCVAPDKDQFFFFFSIFDGRLLKVSQNSDVDLVLGHYSCGRLTLCWRALQAPVFTESLGSAENKLEPQCSEISSQCDKCLKFIDCECISARGLNLGEILKGLQNECRQRQQEFHFTQAWTHCSHELSPHNISDSLNKPGRSWKITCRNWGFSSNIIYQNWFLFWHHLSVEDT